VIISKWFRGTGTQSFTCLRETRSEKESERKSIWSERERERRRPRREREETWSERERVRKRARLKRDGGKVVYFVSGSVATIWQNCRRSACCISYSPSRTSANLLPEAKYSDGGSYARRSKRRGEKEKKRRRHHGLGVGESSHNHRPPIRDTEI